MIFLGKLTCNDHFGVTAYCTKMIRLTNRQARKKKNTTKKPQNLQKNNKAFTKEKKSGIRRGGRREKGNQLGIRIFESNIKHKNEMPQICKKLKI